MFPKVSVIMPSYNVGLYIKKCLNSVVNQTMTDIEILCIDAGSTDGTLESIEKIASADSRIKLIHSDKKSYGYQVNMGLKLAKGEYIAIIETDDFIELNMFEKLYNIAVNNNLDYVKGEFFTFTDDESSKIISKTCGTYDFLYNKIINPADYSFLYNLDSNLWKGLYKKQFLSEQNITLNETPGAAYQDIGFLMQTISKARKAMYVPESYYWYRVDREGSSSVNVNTLKYVYQEFVWLFDTKRVDISGNNYKKMALCYLYELEKFVLNNTDIEKTDIFKAYNWLKNELLDAISSGKLDSNFIPKDRWILLKLALSDYSAFKLYVCENNNAKENQVKEIIRKATGKNIVVWGCGMHGKNIAELLSPYKNENIVYTDGNNSVWNTFIDRFSVVSPSECFKKYKDALYVISSTKYSNEIYSELNDNGITNVYIWK